MFSTPVLPAAAGFAAQNTMLPPAPTGATWNFTDVSAAGRRLHGDGDVLLDDVAGELRPDVLGQRPRLAGRVGDEIVRLHVGVEGDLQRPRSIPGRARAAAASCSGTARRPRARSRRVRRCSTASRTCRPRRATRRRRRSGSGGKSVHSPTHGSGIIGGRSRRSRPMPIDAGMPARPDRPGRCPCSARGFDARASGGADDRGRQRKLRKKVLAQRSR